MDVIQRIRDLMEERGWTEYRLVKETGLPQSTVANIFHRNTTPGISNLEIICGALGVSLCQFFADGPSVPLTAEQEELLRRWAALTEAQRTSLLELMRTMV